jgi:transcriptional regulator with XRE-family HTH domain
VKAFGLAMREIRKEKGFSQEGMALESGFDRTYISMVERGVKSPTVRALFKLAEFLGVKPSEVLRRTEEVLLAGAPPKPRHKG